MSAPHSSGVVSAIVIGLRVLIFSTMLHAQPLVFTVIVSLIVSSAVAFFEFGIIPTRRRFLGMISGEVFVSYSTILCTQPLVFPR